MLVTVEPDVVITRAYALNTPIEGGVQATERGDSLFKHCFHLIVVDYITTDGYGFVTLGNKLICRRADCFLIPVCHHY